MTRRSEMSFPTKASPGQRPPTEAPTVTSLLRAWHDGDAGALEGLMPLLYDDLRRVARAHLRHERASHSLQATALVHEVYLRLAKGGRFTAESRTQFLALAAHLIRQILVDHARRRRAPSLVISAGPAGGAGGHVPSGRDESSANPGGKVR